MRPKQRAILVLPGLIARPAADWRGFVRDLDRLSVRSIALLLAGLPPEERRALYRQLEETKLEEIPYVQIDADTQEWELDYLSVRFKASSFGCPAGPELKGLLATLPHYAHLISVKGPALKTKDSGFTAESLRSIGAPGVCLDAAAFERERIHDRSAHQATLAVLDHFPSTCTHVSVLPSYWHDLLPSRAPLRRLTSLKQLRYLRHLPPNCFGSCVVLELENQLDEMLEIKAYLDFLIKSGI